MGNKKAGATAIEEMRRQTEDLAMALVLSGSSRPVKELGRELAAGVEKISWQAVEAGCKEVTRIAVDLVTCFKSAEASEVLFQDGITRLQQAIEAEAAQSGGGETTPAAQAQAPAARAESVPAAGTEPVNPLAEDPELLSDFVVEAGEHLSAIETKLLILEQDPANSEAIHAVFRGFHTIKGLAGFLELSAIQEVAHDTETVLDWARNGRLVITPAVIDVVLASADYIKDGVGLVETKLHGGKLGAAPSNRALLDRVRSLRADDDSGAGPEAAYSKAADPAAVSAPSVPQNGSPSGAAPQPSNGGPAKGPAQAGEAGSVKVDTRKLDFLVDMVGELVIAQSMVRHDPEMSAQKNARFMRNLSQLARITAEVQKTAMSMRMVPIGQLYRRMARLVRDLSRKAGKPVELETVGDDTELDRTLVEELADPFMHMIRNSIDHGLESAEDREAAGKPSVGRVILRAQHQAGLIVIEIADDGRGLNCGKILAKARQRGLVSDQDQLSETEIFNLIFEPGFSTAEKVTDVSGRGVGMDVVRRHVQKLRGRVEVRSVEGQGTTFLIKLPLTLAIIEGLVVGVGQQRYIVPIYTVREMFRPSADMISTCQGKGEMAMVRQHLLPVVRLYQRFGVQPRSEDPCEGLLIVAECGGKSFCLMVDELIGKQEVVIKSLGETLKNVPGIAGGAIMGDGRVGLILDMDGVLA